MAHDTPPETPPACGVTKAPKYKRLTYQQLRIARDLYREGKSQVQIAQVLGCTQQTVSDALKALGDDTTDLAIDVAKSKAYRRVRRLSVWSETRDKLGLESTKELNRIAGIGQDAANKGDSGNQVLIQIGVAQAPQVTAAGAKVVSITPSNQAQFQQVLEP
jgi:hypothetical protein